MALIDRHNRLLLRRAIGHFVISLVATVVTVVFFYFAFSFLIAAFDLDGLRRWLIWLVAIVMVLNFVGGYVTWQRGIGQAGFHESDLFIDIGSGITGAGTAGSMYLSRATTPAYFVSQIALAASIRLFRGLQDLRLRVPPDDEFEQRLRDLHHVIVEKKTWHSSQPYRDLGTELACLVRLEAVDFSPRKGSVRVREEFTV